MSRCLRKLVVPASLLAGAMALSGCGSAAIPDMNFFPTKPQIFTSRESATRAIAPDLLPSGPVSPEDQVDAAGHCGATAASEPAVGTVAGDLGTTSAAAPDAPAIVPGGISLGMTECQVVARAGQPGQVNIAADENNARKVVLTYPSGPWPGVYTFSDGRLKVMDRVAQPEPPKPARKKGSRAATASTPQR